MTASAPTPRHAGLSGRQSASATGPSEIILNGGGDRVRFLPHTAASRIELRLLGVSGGVRLHSPGITATHRFALPAVETLPVFGALECGGGQTSTGDRKEGATLPPRPGVTGSGLAALGECARRCGVVERSHGAPRTLRLSDWDAGGIGGVGEAPAGCGKETG